MLLGLAVLASLAVRSDCDLPQPQPGKEALFAQLAQSAVRQNPEVLFLGDSITAELRKPEYDQLRAAAYGGIRTANMAIGRDHSGNMLWAVDHLPALSPKVVVILIGANDRRCGWGPEVTVRNTGVAIDRLRAHWPKAKIVLVPPLPRGDDPEGRQGAAVAAAFEGRKHVRVAPMGDLFSHNGQLTDFREPGAQALHPTARGQMRITRRLAPIVWQALR